MMRFKIIIFLFLLGFIKGNSQKAVLKDNGLWILLSSKIDLSEKVYLKNIFELRLVDFHENTQGFFIRTGLHYRVAPKLHVGFGYLYFRFYTNGAIGSLIPKDENRLWQSVIYNANLGKTRLSQRFVFEERFKDKIVVDNGNAYISGTSYSQRIRYKLASSFNLFELKNNKFLMGKVANEVRIRFKNGLSNPSFDQNNFSMYLGYKILGNSKVWLGYGLDYFKIYSNKFLKNNTLRVQWSYDFNFAKKSKKKES